LSYEIMDDAAQAFLKTKIMDNIQVWTIDAHRGKGFWVRYGGDTKHQTPGKVSKNTF
jgi:hypothetical protein